MTKPTIAAVSVATIATPKKAEQPADDVAAGARRRTTSRPTR